MPIYMVKCSSAILNAKSPCSTFKIPAKACQKHQGNFRTTIERVISSEILRTCEEYINGSCDPLIRKSQLMKVIERTLQKTGAVKALQSTKTHKKSTPIKGAAKCSKEESPENTATQNLLDTHKPLIGFTESLQLRISGLETRLSDAMERMTRVHTDIARITDPRSAQAALHYCRKLRHEIKKLRRVRRHFFHYIRKHESYSQLDEETRQHINANAKKDHTDMQERYRRKLIKFLTRQEEAKEAEQMREQRAKEQQAQPQSEAKTAEPKVKKSREQKAKEEPTQSASKHKRKSHHDVRHSTTTSKHKHSSDPASAHTSHRKSPKAKVEVKRSSSCPQIYITPIPSKSQRIRPHKALRAHEQHMFPRAYFEEMHSNYRRQDDPVKNWYVRAPGTDTEGKKEQPTIYGSPMARFVESAPQSREPKISPNTYYSITDTIRAAIKARRNAKLEPSFATASQLRGILRPGMGKPAAAAADTPTTPATAAAPVAAVDDACSEAPQPKSTKKQPARRRPLIQPVDGSKLHDMAKHPHSVDLSRLSHNCIPAKPKYHRRPRFMTELSYLSGESCLFRMKYFNRLCYKRSEISAALNTRDGYCVFPDMAKNRSYSLMPMVRRKAIAQFLLLTPERKMLQP